MTTQTKPWRVIDLINWGTEHFTQKGIDNSRREIEWFLCKALNCERIDLYVRFEELLNEPDLIKLRTMVKRRSNGEPFQHIIGKAPFFGRDFKVNEKVLIPRPETEVLIERLKVNGKAAKLLDVGTGSGCIAITAVLESLAENAFATDISTEAIEVCRENAVLYKIDSLQIARHDFLTQEFKTKFDVVLSNPPYVGETEMASLQAEVRDFEPEPALTDGADGLNFYRRFADQFEELLNPGGYLLLEFGGNEQKERVEEIFSKAGLKTEFIKDLQGDWRVVEVRK